MSSASRWRAVVALVAVAGAAYLAFTRPVRLGLDLEGGTQIVLEAQDTESVTVDGDVAGPVAIAVVLSIVLNVTAGVAAAKLQGFGRIAAANIGLTILGRGEFSLILATLATAAGLDARIGPFMALYVLVLAVLGPLLAARSQLFARLLPARLFPTPPERRAITIPGGTPDG